MTYNETLEFLFNIPAAKEEGLNRLRGLMNKLDNPQKKLKFVHVAGTNGKGSVCAMMSSILKEVGYKTGLNISPHVTEFRERIQVNNKMISEEDVVRLTQKLIPYYDEMKLEDNAPDFFEMVFAIMALYFLEQGCDIVVLEVGLGGRLDSTNVIDESLVSVITSVGIDHVSRLGNTISKIASEKAGIIKPDSITVSYPKQDIDALSEIMRVCSEKNNELIIPHNCEVVDTDIFGSNIIYDGQSYFIPFSGEHQIYNALTVLGTCEALSKKGYALSYEQIKAGMGKTTFPSRMEVLSKEPLIIMDGAHNVSGAKALSEALNLLGDKKIHGIMGMLGEKDVDGVVKEIAPHLCSVVATKEKGNPKFEEPAELAEKFKQYLSSVSYSEDPMEAFNSVFSSVGPDEVILICGSFYLAGAMRKEILSLLEKRV